jgi:hypothetical protein
MNRLHLRGIGGRKPTWRWNEKNGKYIRNAKKGGIDWWRYRKVSSLRGSSFLRDLYTNLEPLPTRKFSSQSLFLSQKNARKIDPIPSSLKIMPQLISTIVSNVYTISIRSNGF